jgi:hypothetical protein
VYFRYPRSENTRANVYAHVATGTAEVGGWTTRELLSILDGLEGLDIIGADVGTYHILHHRP